MKRILLPAVLILLSLTACQLLPPRPMDGVQGGTLTLREAFTLPAGERTLNIQAGEVMSYWDIDQYAPHCRLEFDDAASRSRTLAPATFRIARVTYDWDQVFDNQPFQVAGLRVAGGGANSSDIEIVVLELEPADARADRGSAEAPQLARVRCSQWMDPQWARTPTLEEVRQALGEPFELVLPETR